MKTLERLILKTVHFLFNSFIDFIKEEKERAMLIRQEKERIRTGTSLADLLAA